MRLDFDLDDHGNPIGKPVADTGVPQRPDRSLLLHGTHCRLEPLSLRHARDLWEAFSEDTTGRMWTYLHAGPFADEAEFTTWLTDLCTLDSLHPYAIIDPTSNVAVGFASYLR